MTTSPRALAPNVPCAKQRGSSTVAPTIGPLSGSYRRPCLRHPLSGGRKPGWKHHCRSCSPVHGSGSGGTQHGERMQPIAPGSHEPPTDRSAIRKLPPARSPASGDRRSKAELEEPLPLVPASFMARGAEERSMGNQCSRSRLAPPSPPPIGPLMQPIALGSPEPPTDRSANAADHAWLPRSPHRSVR